jgi:hypothetical protein
MITDHVKKLEQLYGRITACRIVVKGPGNRHKTGGLYDINIRLTLPDGREVDIGRTSKDDERHSGGLPFAINDASSEQAGDFRIARGAWREWSRATKGNPSEPWYGSIPSIKRWRGNLFPSQRFDGAF